MTTDFDDDTRRLRHDSPAPITHIADQNGALLVDYSYGLGRVVVLSDPYIVSNGGIQLERQLAACAQYAADIAME